MSVHMIYYKDGAKMMRPILTAAEYRNLRNGQRSLVAAIRQGDTSLKQRLIQMNYSCLPNDDGSLKGSTRLSTSVGMDIDWTPSTPSVASGDSLPFVGPNPHSVDSLKTPVALLARGVDRGRSINF